MPFDGLESPLSYAAKLGQVIDLVEAPGRWTQRAYRNADGQYCLKEALNIVGAEIFEPIILRAAASAADREFCCIESFNDWPETAHADVVRVLRQVETDIAAGWLNLSPPTARPPSSQPVFRVGENAGGRVSRFWRGLFS
jgi:hypothetical protein